MSREILPDNKKIEAYLPLLEKVYKTAISSQQDKIIDAETLKELNQIANQIMEERRGKQVQQREHSAKEAPNKEKSTQAKSAKKTEFVRPFRDKFIQTEQLERTLLPFFQTRDLIKMRMVNREFNLRILKMISERLKAEKAAFASVFEDKKNSSHEELFKCLCRSLVPDGLTGLFNRWMVAGESIFIEHDDIDELKRLKNFPARFEILFAPLCILLGLKGLDNWMSTGTREKPSWFAAFQKAAADPRFHSRIKGFSTFWITKEKMLQIESLSGHLSSFDVSRVEKWSQPMAKLFKWSISQVWDFVARSFLLFTPSRPALEFFSGKTIAQFKHLKLLENIMKEKGESILSLECLKFDAVKSKPMESSFPRLLKSEAAMFTILSYLDRSEIRAISLTNSGFLRLCESFEEREMAFRILNFERIKLECSASFKNHLPLLELGFFSKAWKFAFGLFVALRDFLCKKEFAENLKVIISPTSSLEAACKLICSLILQSPSRKKVIADGTFANSYFQTVKGLCSSRCFAKKLKDLNPFQLDSHSLIEIQTQIGELGRLLENSTFDQNPTKSSLKAVNLFAVTVICLFKASDLLPFVARGQKNEKLCEESEQFQNLSESADKILKFMREASFDAESLRRAVERAKSNLSNENLSVLRPQEFGELSDEYISSRPLEAADMYLKAFSKLEHSRKLLEAKLSPSPNSSKREGHCSASKFFDTVSEEIIFLIMDFQDIREVPKLATANRLLRSRYRNYIRGRAGKENERLKNMEKAMHSLLRSVVKKRALHYKAQNKPLPEKEHAISLLCEVTAKDLAILKRNVKGSEPFNYFIKPYLTLFNLREKMSPGEKFPAWRAFHAFLLKNDVYKLLSEFVMETLSSKLVLRIEKHVSEESYNLAEATRSSESLGRLVKWIKGLLEIHKYLRRFSVYMVDSEILSEEERQAAELVDSSHLLTFKLNRYLNGLQN